MKRSDFGARFQKLPALMKERRKADNLQKIKVVEDEKHGQNDVDNHTGQNYNVEQF